MKNGATKLKACLGIRLLGFFKQTKTKAILDFQTIHSVFETQHYRIGLDTKRTPRNPPVLHKLYD